MFLPVQFLQPHPNYHYSELSFVSVFSCQFQALSAFRYQSLTSSTMQTTTEGAEILGAQIGHFIGTSFFAATAVSLDSLLSSPIKDAILAVGFVLWFSSTLNLYAPHRIHLFQFIKIFALIGLFYCSMHARHSLTACWGIYLLFERMIRQLIDRKSVV